MVTWQRFAEFADLRASSGHEGERDDIGHSRHIESILMTVKRCRATEATGVERTGPGREGMQLQEVLCKRSGQAPGELH